MFFKVAWKALTELFHSSPTFKKFQKIIETLQNVVEFQDARDEIVRMSKKVN